MRLATILIVDDEDAVRQVLRRFLQVKGFDVLEACDGLEALDALSTHTVDVAVIDLIMPRMGGIELMRRMKSEFPNTKVVVASAYPDVYSSEPNCATVVAVLRKPFELKDLGDAVSLALE